jgi:CBS domain-containing protein
MLVKDYMVTNVITLDPDLEILHATQLLIRHDISGAPVLDNHGRLVGVLTERDCIRVALHAGYHGAPGGQVRDYMSAAPVSVNPDDTIGRKVRQRKVSPLPGAGRRPPGRHDQPPRDNARDGGALSRAGLGKH